MKILITNHHLLDYAGSEIYMLNLAKGIAYSSRQAHGVSVLCHSREDGNPDYILYIDNI